MVCREMLISTSAFFTRGRLLQRGAQSAAENTRDCVEIRSVLAEVPRLYKQDDG